MITLRYNHYGIRAGGWNDTTGRRIMTPNDRFTDITELQEMQFIHIEFDERNFYEFWIVFEDNWYIIIDGATRDNEDLYDGSDVLYSVWEHVCSMQTPACNPSDLAAIFWFDIMRNAETYGMFLHASYTMQNPDIAIPDDRPTREDLFSSRASELPDISHWAATVATALGRMIATMTIQRRTSLGHKVVDLIEMQWAAEAGVWVLGLVLATVED